MKKDNFYTPYTYLVGWAKSNLWYYGARYAKKSNLLYVSGAHPDDLWNTYFTSSEIVKTLRSTLGEPDIVEVRKTFKSEEDSRRWENKVLKRMNVLHEDKWLNRTDSMGIPLSIIIESNKTRICSDETKTKNSRSNKVSWALRKKENPNYIGNRKGLTKVKNILTGEVTQFKAGEYDISIWAGLSSKNIYCTPFGNFTSEANMPSSLKAVMSYPSALAICKNNLVINHRRVNASKYLTRSDIGKTCKELGFFNIPL